jgi:tripartite-type tricarboxylate transporter receptor subunit TctC
LGGQSLGSNIIEALGVAATERAGGIPGVPTFAEQGVKDQEADTLTGIVAPAGTPKDIVDLLSREIATSVARPDVNERLAVLGFKAVGNTPEEFGARIKLEIEKWGKVVRDANLRIERPAGSNACRDRFRNIFQLVEASVTRL